MLEQAEGSRMGRTHLALVYEEPAQHVAAAAVSSCTAFWPTSPPPAWITLLSLFCLMPDRACTCMISCTCTCTYIHTPSIVIPTQPAHGFTHANINVHTRPELARLPQPGAGPACMTLDPFCMANAPLCANAPCVQMRYVCKCTMCANALCAQMHHVCTYSELALSDSRPALAPQPAARTGRRCQRCRRGSRAALAQAPHLCASPLLHLRALRHPAGARGV